MSDQRFRIRQKISTSVLIATLAVAAHADVITVDDDDPAADFATIQDAVDAASDGDRIEVGPGYYVENPQVDGPLVKVDGKSIDIFATAVDPANTILAGQGVRRCVQWTSAGGDCPLRGFTLDSGRSAVEGGGILIDPALVLAGWEF